MYVGGRLLEKPGRISQATPVTENVFTRERQRPPDNLRATASFWPRATPGVRERIREY